MSLVREHSKAIGGILYETRTLPATEALSVMSKCIATFGGALVELFVGQARDNVDPAEGEDAGLSLTPELMVGAMAHVSGKLADIEAKTGKTPLLVVKDLLKYTTCANLNMDGTEHVGGNVADNFDDHFAGNLMHLAEVAIWVGTVNFTAPSGAKN